MSASRKFRRALANRANAQHSTGPVTESGKAISAQNATTHGLTSKQVVIPGEDPKEFEQLKASLYREYRPQLDLENALLDEFIACLWRLNRARRVETAFLTKLTENAPDPDRAMAEAFFEKPAEMQRIQRYVSAIEKAYYRAMTNLHNVMKARAKDADGLVSQNEEVDESWMDEQLAQIDAEVASFANLPLEPPVLTEPRP